MDTSHLTKWAASFFFLIGTQSAHSYTFQSALTHELSLQVESSLRSAPKVLSGELSADSLGIEEIDRAFLELPRSLETSRDMVEAKFLLQNWRIEMKQALLGIITTQKATFGPEARLEAYRRLKTLGPLLSVQEFQTVVNSLPEDSEERKTAHLDLYFIKIPDRDPDLTRWHKEEHWRLNEWFKHPLLSDYRFWGDEVEYKGKRFRSGDLLLVDLMSNSAGLFTVFAEPRHYLTHFSIIVIFEREGNRFPAVIETYGKGIRAVPLREYLEGHISYAEVFRMKNAPAFWKDRLNRKGQRFVYEPHAYDFYARENGDKNLTCAEVGNALFRRTGIPETPIVSVIAPAVRENLLKLGFDIEKILVPTDYALDPRFERVAVIDKGSGRTNIVRQLVISAIGRLFETHELAPEKLGFSYSVRRWASGRLSKPGGLGILIRWLGGYSSDNAPVGPPELMAMGNELIRTAEGAVYAALSRDEIVSRLKSPDAPFSFHDLETDPVIRDALERVTTSFRKKFFHAP